MKPDDDGRTAAFLGNAIVVLLAVLFVTGVAYWFTM